MLNSGLINLRNLHGRCCTKIVLILVATAPSLQASCQRQYFDEPLSYLIPATIPKNLDPDRKILDRDCLIQIYVSDGGELRITNSLPQHKTAANPPFKSPFGEHGHGNYLKVHNGYLTAFDSGEFLWGGMFWIKDSLTGERIWGQAPRYLFKVGNDIVGISSFHHMTENIGRLYRYKFVGDRWYPADTLDLKLAPGPAAYDSARGIFLEMQGELALLDHNRTLHYVKKGFWKNANPLVLIVKDDMLYLSMEGGVYLLNLITNVEQWLTLPSDLNCALEPEK